MKEAREDFVFDGEPYTAGVTRVSGDHPAYKAHPERFAPAGGDGSEIRAIDPRKRPRRQRREIGLFTASEIQRERDERLASREERPKQLEDLINSGQGLCEESSRAPEHMRRRHRDTSPGHEGREAGLRALEGMELAPVGRPARRDHPRRPGGDRQPLHRRGQRPGL